MKKKLISLLLVLTMVISITATVNVSAVTLSAVENGVYVESGATGTGTKTNPYGTIEEAIASFNGKDGTVYINGTYSIKKGLSTKWNGMITITGVDSNSCIVTEASLGIAFGGDITFKDISVKAGLYSHLNPLGTKLIIDTGAGTIFDSFIHLTTYNNTSFDKGYAEFKSGTVKTVYAGGSYSSSYSTTCRGDSNVILNGGTVYTINICGDKYQTNHVGITIGGNLNIIINSGSLNAIDYSTQTVPQINGALNFVFNNGMNIPTKFSYPEVASKGTYIIRSAKGGMVTPTETAGVFNLKADSGKVAYINGEKYRDGTIKLSPGTTDVEWVEATVHFDGAQIRTQGEQGLRFVFAIPEESALAATEYGSVVMPKKYLGTSALEIGTVTTVDGKEYAAKKVPAQKIFKRENGYIYYTVCITGIRKENYFNEYVAIPYIITTDENGDTVTKYGDATKNINVYSIAKAAFDDDSNTTAVREYLAQNIISIFDIEHFFVKGTQTKLFGNTSYLTNGSEKLLSGDVYNEKGRLLRSNEVIDMSTLSLEGNSDDYFLADIVITSYNGKVISVSSSLDSDNVQNKDVTLERSSSTNNIYYIGTNKNNLRVMTGKLTLGKFDAYLDKAKIPSTSSCKNSVRFFELSGKNGDVYTYSPLDISFDGVYQYDSATGSYDKLNNEFAKAFPTLYNSGLYEAEVYDCNGDGFADLVFVKNKHLLKLVESSGSYSGVLYESGVGDYVHLGNANVEGEDFANGDYVLAYENTGAQYVYVYETLKPSVNKITDIASGAVAFENIPDISLSNGVKYAYTKNYSENDLAVGNLYTVFEKDGILLSCEENDGKAEYVLTGNSAEDYIKALYDKGHELSSDAIRRGVDVISEQMKKDILSTPNTAEIYGDKMTGTTYYISEKNGKDTNDGLTPATAFKTIAAITSKMSSATAGTSFLFERGGVYRGRLSVAKDGVILGSYGEGAKPLIIQSTKNYADESLWVETEYENVWKCTQMLTNVGVIGFDHDMTDYSEDSYTEIYGHIMNANILGFTGVSDLNSDLQFYSVVEGSTTSLGDLYLYSEYGNPGKRFASIEMGENLSTVTGAGDDVIIDNLSFKFTGAHAMGGAGGCKDRTVTNCVFSWLGGSVLSLDFRGNGKPVNYGNAVEIYGSCDGYIVQNCWMYQIYDTGVTHQYSDPLKCVQTRVRYLENLIEYCHWGIEFYNKNDNGELPVEEKYTSDVISRYNVVNKSGYGWGSLARQRTTSSHAYCGSSLSTNYDCYTEYNIFNLSAGNVISLPKNSNEIPDKNIYIQYLGNKLGSLKGYSTNCDKNSKQKLSTYYGDKNPLVVIADPSELETDNKKTVQVNLSYGGKTSTETLSGERFIMVPSLPDDAVIPEGKSFDCWEETLTGNKYFAGQPYEIGDKTNVSFTAVFVDFGEIRFVYGDKSHTETYVPGEALTLPNLPANVVIPEGKVFAGWSVGSKMYYEGSSVVLSSSTKEITAVFADRGTVSVTKRTLLPGKLSKFENPYASDGNYTIKGMEIKEETFDGVAVKSYKKVADMVTAERTVDGVVQTTTNFNLNLYSFNAVTDSNGLKVRPFDAKYVTMEYYYDTTGRDTTDKNGQDLTNKKMYYHQLYILDNSTKPTVNWKANSTEGIVANKWHTVTVPLSGAAGSLEYFEDASDACQLQQYKLYPFGTGTNIQMYKGDVFYIKNVTFTSYDPANAPKTERTVKFYSSKDEYLKDGNHTSMTGLKDTDTFTIPAGKNASIFKRFKYWVRVNYNTQHNGGDKFFLDDRDDAIFYAVYSSGLFG